MKPLNVVYIHAHDLGRYCEPMGYPIPAPNLMRLAREGTLFRQAFAAAPSCAPSRAALVTGQYPHCCGMLGLPAPHLGYRLNDYSQHIANYLLSHGVETALAGVQHVARAPMVKPREVLGYRHFLNMNDDEIGNGHDRATTLPTAINFLNENPQEPFFLSVGFCDPHRNNQGDHATFIETFPQHEPVWIEDAARYCMPMPHLPDLPELRREMANFKLGVSVLDAQVGLLLNILDQPQFRNNTLVIFTTDHGPGIPGMKCTLSDRGTGVTLIIRGPDTGPASIFNGGKVIDAMVQHMDLYPTLCELLDIPVPHFVQGKSLLPLMRGEVEELHEMIFLEQTYHYGTTPRPFRAVRTSRYKYIRCYAPEAPWTVDRGPADDVLEAYGYGTHPHPEEQLFDLIFDPHEANNLADRPGHEDLLARMRAHLRAWQEQTNDPLLNGEIPPPPAQNS